MLSAGNPGHGRAVISATHDIPGGMYNGNLSFKVRNGTVNYNNALNIRSSGNVGIGTTEPSEKLEVNGNAKINGNLIITGNLTGEIEIDSIHVSKIVGLLGENYTLIFPDILNNLVAMEIEGFTLNEKVVMISGPGIETERIIGYHDPDHHNDQPGLSMEFPIVFETSGTDAETLITWFDAPDPPVRNGGIIIRDLAGNETSRWILYEYKPNGYEPGNDGRTRFTVVHDKLPDNLLGAFYDGLFGTDYNINPATDKMVEIELNFTGDYFFPEVEVDNDNRTITLTMDYNEGGDIYGWVRQIVAGTGPKLYLSIIETDLHVPPVESSRKNYFGCFPIKYEHIYGFGLNTKLRARIVISFDWWEQG